MKIMKSFKRLMLSLVLAFMAVGMLVVPSAVTVNADENTAVTEDKKGVLQVKVVYVDDSNVSHDIQSGTAFLINDTTAITAEHVVSVDDETMQAVAELWGNGKTAEQCRSKLQIVINVLRDNTMIATVQTSSTELDVAVLALQQAINNRTYLSIRESSTVQQTENCYALGFPADFDPLQTVQTFTSEDVTIQNGQVSKIADITTDTGTASYVVSSAKITAGFSGGPLVDEEGHVIGVLKGSTSSNYFDQDYFYSVATDEIISILESWGIEYTAADGSSPSGGTDDTVVPQPSAEPVVTADKSALSAKIDEANAIDTADYTEESVAEFEAALSLANDANESADATQDEVDEALEQLTAAQDALEEKGGFLSLPIIIGIAAVVVIIIIVIIVLVVRGGKKKEAPSYSAMPAPETPMPPVNNYTVNEEAKPMNSPMPPYSGSADTTVLGGSAGETTVLGGSAGETTVLNQQTYGTLVRKKNGEKVVISKDHFRIGRERNNVDYCISDDSNVGRLHAEIVSAGSKTYVVDKNSRNSTFVNDVRCTPNERVELKDGDRVMFADDEYTYHQF